MPNYLSWSRGIFFLFMSEDLNAQEYVIEVDKINDKNRYFPAKTPKGESFYICNQWGTQTVNFIDYVNNSKDINIQIENVNNRNKE